LQRYERALACCTACCSLLWTGLSRCRAYCCLPFAPTTGCPPLCATTTRQTPHAAAARGTRRTGINVATGGRISGAPHCLSEHSWAVTRGFWTVRSTCGTSCHPVSRVVSRRSTAANCRTRLPGQSPLPTPTAYLADTFSSRIPTATPPPGFAVASPLSSRPAPPINAPPSFTVAVWVLLNITRRALPSYFFILYAVRTGLGGIVTRRFKTSYARTAYEAPSPGITYSRYGVASPTTHSSRRRLAA